MIVGLILLGLLTPPFAVMLLFIFIHSVGGHLWYPLQDTIGLNLIQDDGRAGTVIGRFKGVSTAFAMLAGILVFVGFRAGWFSFTTPTKLPFLLAAGLMLVILILLTVLRTLTAKPELAACVSETGSRLARQRLRFRFVFHREYRFYYALAIVFGVQKQIMFVFAPWVLIDLLDKKADTLALLTMAGAFVGIFFIPALGRWLDRFGIKKLLYADALSFILVYLCYGLLSSGFATGLLAKSGLPVILAFALFIIDRMSMQMGLIRSLYLRSIALRPEDIAPTITLGQSMDHVVSIACAALGGLVWSTWGPQYVFFLAAVMSLVNFFVAYKAEIRPSGAVADA
jgi:MFS family permease